MFQDKNSILLDMVNKNKHDVIFISQIENTSPETKQLLNKLIKKFEEIDYINEITNLQCAD